MKTAISLPDELYERAQQLAQRTRKSRSQIYQEAMTEYLGRHDSSEDDVTESMNKVVARVSHEPDPFVAGASNRILEISEW
jgi:predicted transcriptional regulator